MTKHLQIFRKIITFADKSITTSYIYNIRWGKRKPTIMRNEENLLYYDLPWLVDDRHGSTEIRIGKTQ